ncbi:cytochrome c oxidase assembly protein [Shouchella sp. 1P09AA]|uniref:cytochrome c oxidase assembly protein n=1 Tax=unclassified Shouchella TaxID=2893065 RepID=UPI0039A1B746
MNIILDVTIVSSILYVIFIYLKNSQNHENLSIAKKLAFIIGIVFFAIANISIIRSYGNQFFSVFTMQQTLLYFVVPPLIFTGLNDQLLKPLYSNKWVKPILNRMSKPTLAIIGFNLIFVLQFIPIIFNFIYGNSFLQFLMMLILLPLAFLMWWPVISPATKFQTLQPFAKIIYVIGLAVIMTPLVAFFVISTTVLYAPFIEFHSESIVVLDQQTAGVTMKMAQIIVYSAVIGHAFVEAKRLDDLQTEKDHFL